MLAILVKLFFVAFFINLLYELLHSVFYETCHEAKLEKYIYLIIKGATFDGLVIALVYFITSFVFHNQNIFENYFQLGAFSLITILFAWVWEVYSLKVGKWEYKKIMPLVFGAGLTPLIQLIITGLLSLYLTLEIMNT